MKNFVKAVAAATLVVCGAAHAGTITVIDLFTDAAPQGVSDSSTNGFGVNDQSPSVGSPSATILGGYRELFVSKTGVGAGASSLDVDAGQLSFTSGNGGATGLVRWDGAAFTTTGNSAALSAIDATGLGHKDIGNAATDFFNFTTNADFAFTITIRAYTDGGNWSSVTRNIAGGGVDVSTNIALSSFVTQAGTGVNFDDLGALELQISGPARLDMTLNQVSVVPEPASVALAGIALLGMGALARRRKSAQESV